MFYTSYTKEIAIVVILEVVHAELDIKELIVTHVTLAIMCHPFKMEKMFVQVRYYVYTIYQSNLQYKES